MTSINCFLSSLFFVSPCRCWPARFSVFLPFFAFMALPTGGLDEGHVVRSAPAKLGWFAAAAVALTGGAAYFAYRRRADQTDEEEEVSGESVADLPVAEPKSTDPLNVSWCDLIEAEEENREIAVRLNII